MKWFKHYTEASVNAKIERLEARLGLIGYAAYFKILELCAEQYDGVSSDSVFVFNWVTLQNKLRMKRKSIQNLFRITSELNFWKAEQNEYEVTIDFPKLLEYRHKDALPSKLRPALGRKKPRLDLDKDKELDLDVDDSSQSDPKNHQVNKFHESFDRHPDSGKFETWLVESELSSPKLKRESSKIMKAFGGFGEFEKWWKDFLPALKKIETPAEQKRYASGAILNEAGVGQESA